MELILLPLFAAFAMVSTHVLLSSRSRNVYVGPHWHSVELYSREAPASVAQDEGRAGSAELTALSKDLATIEARAQVFSENAIRSSTSKQLAA